MKKSFKKEFEKKVSEEIDRKDQREIELTAKSFLDAEELGQLTFSEYVAQAVKDEIERQRIERKTPSSEYVSMSFKVPKQFRQRFKELAYQEGIKQVELLEKIFNEYSRKNE